MFFFVLLNGAVFVRVVVLVGVGCVCVCVCVGRVWRCVTRRQVCCCLGVEKERTKVTKVCVCVCVCVGGYGWRGEKWRVRFSAKGHKGHNIVVNNVLVNTK